MRLRAWACWAIAVVFVSGVLQLGAFSLVHAPAWGLADALAQGAIWAAVLVFALGMRPSGASTRMSERTSPHFMPAAADVAAWLEPGAARR